MSKYEHTKLELQKHLTEQLGSLQRLALLFDEGYHAEATRMATILRVLLHSKKYPSLMKQLGLTNTLFLDTAHQYRTNNMFTHHGLVAVRFRGNEISYIPLLDGSRNIQKIPFDVWWSATIFSDGQKRILSRADVVLTAADQNGGAHVDRSIREDYAELRYRNSLGILTHNNVPPSGDPVYASIRQISHEVLKTFVKEYHRTREDADLLAKEPNISDGELKFSPHTETFFQNNTLSFKRGFSYSIQLKVNRITTGSVYVLINNSISTPITSQGTHIVQVTAGSERRSGVVGEYTDATIELGSFKFFENNTGAG